MTNQSYIINAKKIYSLDSDNHSYQSMLIKNGRIKELSNLPLPYNIEQISHPDKYIIPGFIDSHTHILGTGMQKIFPEVSGIESLEQLFDIIAAASYLARQYKFLLIYNFQPDKIKEKRYPTQNELDTVIKDYPVLLYRIDGHSGVLNTKGLEEIIAADNKVLENGAELDPYQEPTGVMRGKAYEFTARHFNKKIHPEIRLQAFIKACQLAIQAGVTTLVTMLGTEVDNITCELLLENQVKLPIDVIPFYQTRDINRIQKLGLPRIGGCILVDGSYGSHTAALTEPYADKPDNKGILYLSDQTLEEFYRAADANNLQTAVHAIGDRAIEQVVRVFEKFLKDNQKRHRIEHCELLSDNLIKRIADLGLIACVQPAFEHYWGGSDKMYAERLGLRWQNTNPFQKMIEKGIIIAGGSDAPITPINPLLGIRTATDMRNSENSISLWHALRMFTYNGAYAVKMENQIGSLQLGLKADFVILEHDPLQTANNKIRQAYKEGTLLLNNI